MSQFSFEAAIFGDENNTRIVKVPVGTTEKGTTRYASFSIEGYADRTPEALDKLIRSQESDNISVSTSVTDKDGIVQRDKNARQKDYLADAVLNFRKQVREANDVVPVKPKKAARKSRKSHKVEPAPAPQPEPTPAS